MPIYGEGIYVYARVFNKGLFDFPSSFLKFYKINIDPPHDFPDNRFSDSFFLVAHGGEQSRAGTYVLKVKGNPGEYKLQFKPQKLLDLNQENQIQDSFIPDNVQDNV